MATQITEQARSSLDSPQRTIDEARDLDSQRASSLLEDQWIYGLSPIEPSFEQLNLVSEAEAFLLSQSGIDAELLRADKTSDFLPTSHGSQQSVTKTAAGRGFFRT